MIYKLSKNVWGGAGRAAVPPASIRVSRLGRRMVGFSMANPSRFAAERLAGLLILFVKSMPYNFGRPLLDRSCFREKEAKVAFRYAELL
jgi:hypothetical protein